MQSMGASLGTELLGVHGRLRAFFNADGSYYFYVPPKEQCSGKRPGGRVKLQYLSGQLNDQKEARQAGAKPRSRGRQVKAQSV